VAPPIAIEGVADRGEAAPNARPFAQGDLNGSKAQRLTGEG
jgi:hypothetical protein